MIATGVASSEDINLFVEIYTLLTIVENNNHFYFQHIYTSFSIRQLRIYFIFNNINEQQFNLANIWINFYYMSSWYANNSNERL